MPRSFDVVTVGSALRDVMYYSDAFSIMKNPSNDPTRAQLLCIEFGAKIRSDSVYFEFGGGASNTAVACALLGLRTGIITAVGDDLDGRAIRSHLKKIGIDSSFASLSRRHRTGFSFVAVDEHSGEHTAFVYYGATQEVRVTPALLRRIQTKWFYVSSLTTSTKSWKTTLQSVLASGARVAWNPGGRQLDAGFSALRPLFAKTSVLILNADEAAQCIASEKMTTPGRIPQMLKHIQSWGPAIVVITDSHRGSWAFDGTRFYHIKNPKDQPVDTTGAGDSYGSSFVAGLIRYRGDVERAMQLATVNATANVRIVGAQQGLLRWDELPKKLRRLHR